VAVTAKPEGYYAVERTDMVAELPRPLGRVLDVGCGEGGTGRALRAAGASEIWGVELMPEAAERARAVLDGVVCAPVEEALASEALPGPFDTICCYDVLEHLVDPPAVLAALSRLAAPGGRLHISIPNARHLSLVVDLLFRGTFGYREFGHRDATHLRWYTRRDIIGVVDGAGWTTQSTRPSQLVGRVRVADRLTLGRAQELLTLQWHLLAVRA
jgi:2-polyprenyl-3-methyl-5-hydroxy-6-metoxy-1,4-benzoquinol methylase